MTKDSAFATERNEIDFMLQSLQSDVTDGKHTWLFVIKQLSDVFTIMAFDKLKASREILMQRRSVKRWGLFLIIVFSKHLHLSDDYSNLILVALGIVLVFRVHMVGPMSSK